MVRAKWLFVKGTGCEIIKDSFRDIRMREYKVVFSFSMFKEAKMKYKEQEFTLELKEKIQCMEKEIERISLKLFKDYSHFYTISS
ncbi:hypothetical protein D0U04_09240 [Bacillus clarus]|uniref:Uncharacterized protein n=1 Tax=Bacillus clarus TaxID=2338372 RepID=A0ABX9KX64_9BACI|nr:hypothetical protein D0U04_09240 [Bacillus clarus]